MKGDVDIDFTLNILIRHYLDFTETDWSKQKSHDHLYTYFTNSECLVTSALKLKSKQLKLLETFRNCGFHFIP